jgi:hypothetical protein
MNVIPFLGEWGIRSMALIAAGGLLLRVLRVKDPAVRLAAWTAMLWGSLAMPVLTAMLPAALPVAVPAEAAMRPMVHGTPLPVLPAGTYTTNAAQPVRGTDLALAAYAMVAGFLLLRLGAGMAVSRRLIRSSRPTGIAADGIEVRDSDEVSAPVTLGIIRSVILLPCDWPQWDGLKLEAVLAHERSHIRRRDPAVQLLSAIHRALLWYSPLSWLVHRRIVRLAEDASDDAAVAATQDRASYAELLLEFVQRGVRRVNLQGVAMARYGRPEDRIHRILDGTTLSRGMTRKSVIWIAALGAPLAYLAAATQAEVPEPVTAVVPVSAVSSPSAPAAAQAAQQPPARAPQATAAQGGAIRRYMIVRGDNMTGSWDSRDPVDRSNLRARYGQNFAWFRQGANEYVVTDAAVLKELEQAMEPQEQVNRSQEQVNHQQDEVNKLQAGVNGLQGEVNAMQDKVNRRQDIVNRIQSAVNDKSKEELVKELEHAIQQLRATNGDADQASVNRKQAEVNAAQAKVNSGQQEVNREQAKVPRA